MKRPAFLALGLLLPLSAAALRAASPSDSVRNEVKIDVRDGFRYITSNGIPDHATGAFPNRGNPNAISPQHYAFRVPVNPVPSEGAGSDTGQNFGIAVNGVPFDPTTAEFWNRDPRWRYEAMTGFLGERGGLGVDQNLAHVQPSGAYHYHGLPMGLLTQRDWQHRMALVGWAADGYPIYGNYGYTNATSNASPLKKLTSSYRLRSGNRTGGPGGAFDGSFDSDYTFVKGAGDLDPWNGRYGVTPEFPGGTYYYVLTDTFPFIPRKFRGVPDSSFQRRGPGGKGGALPGGAAIKATEKYLFLQRGNTLYQYSADGLRLLGKTEITPTGGGESLGDTEVAVRFVGGHETDPRDGGRPVTLIAAALGVPAEVFRAAFRQVTPARGGSEPEPAQVQRNKAALLRVLSPYGITNERLDAVSNYYRYNGSRGEQWRNTPAAAIATLRAGKVTGIRITRPGAGYSSPPIAVIDGIPGQHLAVRLTFGTDLTTNGSVTALQSE